MSRLSLSRKGFTLLELIVVMAVVSILMAMGVPRFIGYTKDAEVTAMKVDAELLEQCSLQYALINDDEFPVGDVYEPEDPDVLAIIDDVLSRKGVPVTSFQLSSMCAFREFDESKLGSYIRSTKYPIDSYFIVVHPIYTDEIPVYFDELEGYVFSKRALMDRHKCLWSGIWRVEKSEGGTGDANTGDELPAPVRDIITGKIEIGTPAQLAGIGIDERYPLDEDYIQMENLDLSGYTSGGGWLPIGYHWGPCGYCDGYGYLSDEDEICPDCHGTGLYPYWDYFTGSFDGNGYVISNLTINRPEVGHMGLFAELSNAELVNVSIDDALIDGWYFTGSLAGSISNSVIRNCYSTGVIRGVNYTGGLIGDNSFGTLVENCYFVGAVKSPEPTDGCVGGLLGSNHGDILNCYAIGSVEGYISTGGFTGYNGYDGTITYCYAACSVSGSYNVGGFYGSNYDDTIDTIISSYYDKDVAGGDVFYSSLRRDTAQMKQQLTYEGWGFVDTWGIDEDESYPYLLNNEQLPHPQ